MQNSEPLGPNLRTHGTDTGDVTARSVQAGDEAKIDRVAAGAEDDRNCRGAGFGSERGWCRTGTDDDGNAATDQIGRQFRQPLGFIVRPSVFDLYVAALKEADFTQAFAECREHRCAGLGRTSVEISDHRHWRLLRTCRDRPRRRRAAEQRDERAAPHVWMAPRKTRFESLSGFHKKATRATLGTHSFRISNRLAMRSGPRFEFPVMFPPGWARLTAKPALTASPIAIVTIGIVDVACRAARVAGEPKTTMTFTG